MSIAEPGPASSESLVNRVKGILMSPAAEWDKIDAEPATIQGLYTGYVVILAAIPVIAHLVGSLVFGYGAFGIEEQGILLMMDAGLPVGTLFDSRKPAARSDPQAVPVSQQRQNRAAWHAIALLKIPKTVPIITIKTADPEPHPDNSLGVLGKGAD